MKKCENQKLSGKGAFVAILVLSVFFIHPAPVFSSQYHSVGQFNDFPINIVEDGAAPRVVINASNDHQLYHAAYSDYADVDSDGMPETTYKHSINYYGYFDSYKCYTYDTADLRFEPDTINTDKYCNDGTTGQWSGNFLNWAAMSRIDAIRKVLFGGHRRVDTSTETVLERTYLPHDAHSWAKYYKGDDTEKLTPFVSGTDYNCDDGDAISAGIANPLCSDPVDPEYFECTGGVGDAPDCNNANDPYNWTCSDHTTNGSAGYNACQSIDSDDKAYDRDRFDYDIALDYLDVDEDGNGVDWKMVGVTFGNTTDVDMGAYSDQYSEEFIEPPLIKAVKGNYTLWASNERWQVTWASGSPIDNHNKTNANDPKESGIYAYSSSPAWGERMGVGNYVARVQVCISADLKGKEKCKLYPGADGEFASAADIEAGPVDDIYKPIGLLQTYGDDEQMQFGMISGSYNKHASGGVIVRNVGDLTDEVNVDTDGTFPKVAQFAGGPSANDTAEGLINAWSLSRIIGYDGDNGTYNKADGDNCKWGLSNFDHVTDDNRCQNWGNPFSEIYYQSINYLAGGGEIDDYHSDSPNLIPGLPVPQDYVDPLDEDSYCAQLFVVNLNASSISYDYDEMDDVDYAPSTIWDPAVLPGDKSTSAMTDDVGGSEDIHGNKYFVGEVDLGEGTDDQLCTEKVVTSLGSTGGICPESPRLLGSYRMAGLAYYAHVEDIRPDDATDGRALQDLQTIDTFSVALASGLPVIEIIDPTGESVEPLITILPACRNTNFNPDGNCALVDFKIVKQEIDVDNKIARGSFYIDWEDSEQGGDYDQDMWGVLDYELDVVANTIAITTQVHAKSTPFAMGFGYVIGGTADDGFHAHSGIQGYVSTETADDGSPDCTSGCWPTDASTKTYTLGTATADLLEDPLWYAAKWGGFKDSNDNKLPDLGAEWDSAINATGEEGTDGIPDNYFFAANPRELEDSLARVFDAILERASSSTAAAVVTSNVSGEGALFQAYFEPLRKDTDKEARWLGTVQALWLDSSGLSRQDCTPPQDIAEPYDLNIDSDGKCKAPLTNCVPNGRLDNYCVDQVVETYYDAMEGRTKMRIFESNEPDEFTAYSMQGVVTSYNSGSVTMVPNSMEGMASYASGTITVTPYELHGTITGYDEINGFVTMTVAADDWIGPDSDTFSVWEVTSDSGAGVGFSTQSMPLVAGTHSFEVFPVGTWLAVGHNLTLKTKNLVGATGQTFSKWDVECLEGAPATYGSITNSTLQLNNAKETSASIITEVGDFSTCTRASLSSYDMSGTEYDLYSEWVVSNLTTGLGKGTSGSDVTLVNSGPVTFSVSPTDNWLTVNDQVFLSNYSSVSKELYEVSYIWNAREQLYLSDLPAPVTTDLETNRGFSVPANFGRHITTWIDMNLDNVVDEFEHRPLEADMLTAAATDPVSYTFFDVDDQAAASSLIDYIRGIEQVGSRNRTITYSDSDTSENVMRLGDIVNSTPTVVGSPQEAFDLLYFDDDYREFRQQYIDRRIMVYVGANDGLLHAFNGGFYNVVELDDKNSVEYSIDGFLYDHTTPAAQHPLGSEIWAYAPKNLLAHLQWLQDPAYRSYHVSFMDLKPRVFDAKIFADDPDHPNGYGTVMVVGMRLGGGEMQVDIDTDYDGAVDAPVTRHSAYVVFDITNPEAEPRLLGEIVLPDKSFTSVYPAVAAFQDISGDTNCEGGGNTVACNRWYLVFGNGPDDRASFSTTQSAKLYYFDLKQLLPTNAAAPTGVPADFPAGCTLEALTDGDNPAPADGYPYNIIECDTSVAASFVGTPMVVDWDLDFMADSMYVGLVGDTASDSGRVMKMAYNNDEATTGWSALETLYITDQPISAQVVPSFDNLGNHWLFFGSGRLAATADKTNDITQSLLGIKDMEALAAYPVTSAQIMDVTDAEVYADGTLEANSVFAMDGTPLTTFEDLEEDMDDNALGWKLDLPPIVGDPADPTTRSLTRSALLGGVLFSSVFQPSEDPCSGEGQSRLYGLYYKTGTAFPSVPPVFGTDIETIGDKVKYRVTKFVELGQGASSTPSIHSGRGSGDRGVKVFTQLSTGEMVQSEATTITTIRSGRTSWDNR